MARAMISANDRFFGGAESVAAGRLVAGREGKDLLPLADDVLALLTVDRTEVVLSRELELFGTGREVEDGLLVPPSVCRSAGRVDAFDGSPFTRDGLAGTESVRAVLELAVRSSSSAFRFDNTALGRGTGFGDGVGFSPVIDASKSRIAIVADGLRCSRPRNLRFCVDPPRPHTDSRCQVIERRP